MAARDVLFAGAVLFILAIGFFVLNFTSGQIASSLTNSPLNESSQAVNAINDANTAVSKVDYIFLAVFIALLLGIIITGWFIGGNPIFMFIYFLIIVIAVLVGAILSNFWETLTGASVFGASVASLPIMNHILLYLPFYLAAIGFIGIIVMFAKPNITGEYIG
jgi:hypothetical protein